MVFTWPDENINGIPATSGNSGYGWGPDVGYALGSDDSDFVDENGLEWAGNGGLIGYVSTGDAKNAYQNGGKGVQCTFNGVAATTPNVQQGLYSMWTYEHLYYRTPVLPDTRPIGTIADALAADAAADTGNIQVSSMNAARTAEGGKVSAVHALQ